eukprot:gene9023-9195_t
MSPYTHSSKVDKLSELLDDAVQAVAVLRLAAQEDWQHPSLPLPPLKHVVFVF